MHLSNHALGLISVRAQEAVRPWVMAVWHSPPGQVLLYGSLSVHLRIALIVISTPPLSYAGMGGESDSTRPDNSLSVAGPHRKHPGHPHPYRYRHRLHLRDRQSLGRSLDPVSTNRARFAGVGTFHGGSAFLVAGRAL